MKRLFRSNLVKASPWLWLLLAYLFYIWFLNAHITQFLDADMSSEMVLSNHLSKVGGILTPDWYYSTELRVLNTQLVISPVFRVFSDWHVVRIVSSAVLMAIMLACYYYLCRQIGCKTSFPLTASILLLPFSYDYFQFVMLGLYYIPHLSIAFLSVGLMFQYARSKKRLEQTLLLLISTLLAFLVGLGGPRQIVCTYIPMLVASGIPALVNLKKQGYWGNTGISHLTSAVFFLIGSLAGYWLNSNVLAEHYTFRHYELSFQAFSWDRLFEGFRGILSFFGNGDGYLDTPLLTRNVISIILLCLTLIIIVLATTRVSKVECCFFSLFLLTGVICFVGLYTFTDMGYSARYLLPLLIILLPLLALMMAERSKTIVRRVSTISILLIILSSCLYYSNVASVDRTAGIRATVSALDFQDYRFGYSTFWNGNLMTELSNGRIEIHDWLNTNTTFDLTNVDRFHRWLQLKQRKKTPDGKLFLLFTESEFENYTLCQNMRRENAFYDSNGYIVFTFEDYDAMKAGVQLG